MAVAVKAFNWDYEDTQDNSGAQFSLNWQSTPNVNLGAWASNEISAIDTQVNPDLPALDEIFFGVRMRFTANPVRFKKNNHKANMITQMTQPVRRRYDVLLERYAKGSSFVNRAAGS